MGFANTLSTPGEAVGGGLGFGSVLVEVVILEVILFLWVGDELNGRANRVASQLEF
jgi:hypothetical protein